MCKIIPFARQRFTPSDLVSWNNIVRDRKRRGLWHDVRRITGAEFDWQLVWLPELDFPTLRLERDLQGEYRLAYYDGQGWYEFRHGPAILDCLTHMDMDRPDRRHAGRAL